ncbi:LTA synthase family protein [Cohnella sp. 56]|uniref:LTA synthase family protein n=1 Tax=Cohnella sp. 56 TaxID=3113722 RepID=UPI0030E76578
MHTQLRTTASKWLRMIGAGLAAWPYWAAMLLVISVVYKLNWLDHQLNVGGMNEWKWKVNYGAMVIVTFWLVWLGRRTRAIVIALLDILLSILLFADLVYFRYFKDFLSVPVLLQANQVSSLEDSIWSLVHRSDLILFCDIPAAVAFAVWTCWHWRPSRLARIRASSTAPKRSRARFMLNTALAAVLLAMGITLIAGPVNQQKNGWATGLFVGNWWNIPIYNVTGLLGFHGYDTYRYAKEHWFGGGVSHEQIQEARDWFGERKQLQDQAMSEPMFGAAAGKNVLIIQAEAFQSFVIGQTVEGKEITPYLNALIGKSLYFPNFYHQTGQGRTSDADFLTSCSLHPMPTGSVFIRFADHDFNCLPEILNGKGYDTTIHHAYDGSFWNRNNMYHNMEYGKFYNIKDFNIDEEPLGWSLGDKSFLQQTVDQIQERGASPFYAMAITISGHHPFNLPDSKTEFEVGAFEGATFGDYIKAAHYVDAAIGELVDRLQQEGLWDNTALMLYGDHDNSLYDKKPYEQLLGKSLSDEEMDAIIRKVPFFIHFPGDEYAGVSEKTAGQLDTAPTILQMLGIPMGDNKMMGVSMLSAAEKPVVFRTGGFTDGKVYYTPSNDGSGAGGACYSLADGAAADMSACAAGKDAAQLELQISDLVVEHDLLPVLKKEE